jgi:hypothetical protein
VTTLVRQTGWVDWDRAPGKRTVLQTSTGESLLIVLDANNSAPVAGWGDHTNVAKLYVYHATNSTKSNWTLRATINAPGGTTFVANMQNSFSADLGSDDKIHICAKGTTGSLYYCTVTYSTWAVGAWETVATSVSLTWQAMDISVSETNTPIVAAYYTKASGPDWAGVVLLARRAAAWLTVNTLTNQASAAIRPFTYAISICWIKNQANTARDFAYAFSVTTAGTDTGVVLYTGTLNETTTAVVSGHTLRGTYTSGDVSKTAAYVLQARSIMIFPQTGDNTFLLSMQTYYPKQKFNVVAWKKTAGTWATQVPLSTLNGVNSVSLSIGGMTQIASGGYVTFVSNGLTSTGGSWNLIAQLVKVSGTTATWGVPYYFNDLTSSNPYNVQGGSGTQWSHQSGKPEVMYGKRYTSGKYDLMHDFIATLRAPAGHTPSAGEVVTSSTPPVSMNGDLDRVVSQGRVKGTWYFATDAAFTTNLRIFTQDDSKLQSIDGTDVPGKTVTIRDNLPLAQELFQGAWYVKAAQTSEYGTTGAFDTATQFTVSHPPQGVPLAPVGYQSIQYGAGSQEFSWRFSDAYPNDEQTAYQAIIERVDTGATLYDTGKVISTDDSYIQAFVAGDKGLDLRWKVRLWDMDDVVGPYSEYGTFTVLDAPTIVINSPDGVTPVATALPVVQFTPTVAGGRTITRYRIIISQGATTVFDSNWVPGPSGGWASGTVLNYSKAVSVLSNNQDYTYQVRVTDNTGLESRSSVLAHTTWTLPSAPDTVTIDLTSYNTEDQGYVTVNWTEATPDADFRAWIVLRRDRLVDTITGLDLEVGDWTEIGRTYDPLVMTFKDYYAPSGYSVDYGVQQMVDRFGDQIPSVSTTATAQPRSDGYWFIIPGNDSSIPDAFRLSNVTADSYTDEYEKEIFTVLDGGRKVDQGQHLGLTGSLTAQLRDSSGQSARQKKHRLEIMKRDSVSQFYMRTPFGDLYRCYVSDLQVSRIAGVGTSEFVDVTVPYMEVGE